MATRFQGKATLHFPNTETHPLPWPKIEIWGPQTASSKQKKDRQNVWNETGTCDHFAGEDRDGVGGREGVIERNCEAMVAEPQIGHGIPISSRVMMLLLEHGVHVAVRSGACSRRWRCRETAKIAVARDGAGNIGQPRRGRRVRMKEWGSDP